MDPVTERHQEVENGSKTVQIHPHISIGFQTIDSSTDGGRGEATPDTGLPRNNEFGTPENLRGFRGIMHHWCLHFKTLLNVEQLVGKEVGCLFFARGRGRRSSSGNV